MVATTPKISIQKNKSFQVNSRNCKYLNRYSFNEDLKLAFSNTDTQTCEESEEMFLKLLDHHASFKNFKN